MYVGREEQITEAAMYWNLRKIQSLPKDLCNRLIKVSYIHNSFHVACFTAFNSINEQTKKRLVDAKKVLQQHVGDDLPPSKPEEYTTEIQGVATRM